MFKEDFNNIHNVETDFMINLHQGYDEHMYNFHGISFSLH